MPPAELTACILTEIWAGSTSTEEHINIFATCSLVSKQWAAIIKGLVDPFLVQQRTALRHQITVLNLESSALTIHYRSWVIGWLGNSVIVVANVRKPPSNVKSTVLAATPDLTKGLITPPSKWKPVFVDYRLVCLGHPYSSLLWDLCHSKK
ncbi:hypothetical protein F5146DRAFT_273494 [Armillaria mellea]|nr:hypothetical protein F5146DRAFT_273494 [Armillaria mellea]